MTRPRPYQASEVYHKPVLLQEVIDFLNPKAGTRFIDATLGGAGHAQELTKRGAEVLGIDRDPDSLEFARSKQIPALTIERGNFADIGEIAKRSGFDQIDGILFDLGVSSNQLDNAQRGFSFTKEGPLDMRMDPNLTVRASDIINNFDERRLSEIFKTYGQEKFSRSIANAICSARQVGPIETTTELAEIVKRAIPRGVRREKIHKATRTFQALRIVVNSELLNLEQALPQTPDLIRPGGRLVVISFHSLEDAIVKRFFKQEKQFKILTKNPIGPQDEEIEENPRSRSAKLRAGEKI
ncbi:MAG: 16S rRNA (cytosine(1402)-N(4))-methyltransferase RsmH [Candidatus Curtissbacteria bacterium]|nr:16S rRNA (cytosine(1402)-N(4))-methyltransferase RsmH [Candidatus Curtissbacteria bacterium]